MKTRQIFFLLHRIKVINNMITIVKNIVSEGEITVYEVEEIISVDFKQIITKHWFVACYNDAWCYMDERQDAIDGIRLLLPDMKI